MGCDASISTVSARLSLKEKSDLREVISKDDIRAMVLLQGRYLSQSNTDLSESENKWISIHYCCRWDSPRCLEYLLKLNYINQPRDYVSFVNKQTSEGHSCLHLCAIWGADICFKMLVSYGGLGVSIKDTFQRDALATAIDYRRKNMSLTLQKLKDSSGVLTPVNHENISKQISLAAMENPYVAEQPLKEKPIVKQEKKETAVISEKEKQLVREKEQIEREKVELRTNMAKKEQQLAQTLKRKKASNDMEQIQKREQESRRVKEEEQIKIQQELRRKEQEAIAKKKELQKCKEEQLQKRIAEQKKRTDLLVIDAEENQRRFQLMRNTLVQSQIKPKEGSNILPSPPATNSTQKNQSELPPNILALYEEAKKNGSFVDKDFPHNNSSLGSAKFQSKINSISKDLVWLRPYQFFSGPYQLFDGIDPNDIKQGQLGVCYALATLSELARTPQKIKKLFAFSDVSIGFYVLKFYRNGVLVYIPVDDFIPCNRSSKQPLFTKPIGNEVWVLMVEKAWAKSVGSYFGAQSMTPDHCMEDLTGAPSYGNWFKDQTDKTKDLITRSLKNDSIVLTSSDKQLEGIVKNHAYSLLEIIEHEDARLYKIRNPWGRFEWNGVYGKNSSLWTPDLIKKCNETAEDDGIFFLSEAEILEAYAYYSVCMIQPNSIYSYIQITSQPEENLYFTFQLSKDTLLDLRVTQPFQRMINDESYQYSPLVFEVGRIEGEKVKFLTEGNDRCFWGNKSVHADQDILKTYTKGKYFIRLKFFWSNPLKYSKAVLAAYTEQKIVFDRLREAEGLALWKKLLINFVEDKPQSDSGNIKYKMEWMRGQMICFAFLNKGDEAERYKVQWTFDESKLQNCKLGLEKKADGQIYFQVGKGKANSNVGTLDRLVINQGCSSGNVTISGTKI